MPPPLSGANQPVSVSRLQMQLHLQGLQQNTNALRKQLSQLRNMQVGEKMKGGLWLFVIGLFICVSSWFTLCIWANKSSLHEAFVLKLVTAAYWSPVNNMKFQQTEGSLILCSDTDVFTYPRELPDERDRVLMCQPDQTWFLSVKTLTYGLWGCAWGAPGC